MLCWHIHQNALYSLINFLKMGLLKVGHIIFRFSAARKPGARWAAADLRFSSAKQTDASQSSSATVWFGCTRKQHS